MKCGDVRHNLNDGQPEKTVALLMRLMMLATDGEENVATISDRTKIGGFAKSVEEAGADAILGKPLLPSVISGALSNRWLTRMYRTRRSTCWSASKVGFLM